MNTPHTHPRATELLYLVTGEMEAGFIEENGARFVKNTLTSGQGTLFPQGSIHYQLNTGCDPVLFVAALSDEDPGTSQIAQRCEFHSHLLVPCPLTLFPTVFGLPLNVTQATLGDIGLQEVDNLSTGVGGRRTRSGASLTNFLQVPDSMAIGIDMCLQKCGLTRGNQTTSQQQPRNADNALALN